MNKAENRRLAATARTLGQDSRCREYRLVVLSLSLLLKIAFCADLFGCDLLTLVIHNRKGIYCPLVSVEALVEGGAATVADFSGKTR